MSEPYFISNDIFRGKRGADCAYLFQNVIEAQSRHMRKWPRRGEQRRKESPSVIGEFVRMLAESGNLKPRDEEIAAFLKYEKNEAAERRQRSKEALIERMRADSERAAGVDLKPCEHDGARSTTDPSSATANEARPNV